MLSVAESISELLFLNDVVVVPGLGAFVRRDESASANVITHQFSKPQSSVSFDATQREDNDLISDYLSLCNNIPSDETAQQVVMFVSECLAKMKAGEKVVLPNLGTLSFDAAHEIVFAPDNAVDFNPDAFGLCDFSATPVFQTKTKEEIKSEIEQQQKDKNTPMTVDSDSVHQDDEKPPKRHRVWLWIALIALLALGGVVALDAFEVVNLGIWERIWKEKPVEKQNDTIVIHADTLSNDTAKVIIQDTLQPQDNDSLTVILAKEPDSVPVQETQERAVETEPVSPSQIEKPQSYYVIVMGCYSTEENALVMVNSLKENGLATAFAGQRGKLWDVYSGSYATMDEAKAAMKEIREKFSPKVWILQKK